MARTTIKIFAALIGAAAFASAALAAPMADDDGPQWPNVPLPAPEENASPLSREAFEARWPTVLDDVTGTTLAQPARKPVWIGEERAPAHVFEQSGPSAFTGELGLRYWFSWAKTGKDLYGIGGGSMVSRLTYDGMHGHAAEGFGRLDYTSGFYTKGYVGGGLFFNGHLNDEDFPPLTTPYSSTLSDLKGSSLAYVSADIGFNLWRDPKFRLGAFAGYHYFNQRVNAYGCTQIATNSSICGASPVPYSVEAITQDNNWHSLRVGVDFDLRLGDRLKLRADAAYLPYVKLSGTDTHHLRVGTSPGDFTGGIPEDGTGSGYQLEAALSYAVTDNVDIAVGGRYWHMDASGNTHFEGHVVGGGSPQPVDWKTDIFGVFVQGSFKFGPYATGSL